MTLADSGDRTALPSGAVRDLAAGRGRFDLLSPFALEQLAIQAEKGAEKYSTRNWENGFPLSSLLNSLLRHANSLAAGRTDEDHAVAVMWNAMAYIHTRHMIETGALPWSLAADLHPLHVPPSVVPLVLPEPELKTSPDDFPWPKDIMPSQVCRHCSEKPDAREITVINSQTGAWMHRDCWYWADPSTVQ